MNRGTILILLVALALPAWSPSADAEESIIERRRRERAERAERNRRQIRLVGETTTAVNTWGQSVSFCYQSSYRKPVTVEAKFLGDTYVLPAQARPGQVECANISVRKFGEGPIKLRRAR